MRDSEIRINGETFARIPGAVAEAFFATVSYRLEPQGWGTRFPATLNELYHGGVSARRVGDALSELDAIENELRALPVDKVVWDFQDLRRRDDSDQAVNHVATSAQEYFVSSRGVALTVELKRALAFSVANEGPLQMRTLGSGSVSERLQGLLWALFGAAWVGVGYRYFPNWLLQPLGATSNHGVVMWPFGMVFVALGLGVMIKGTQAPMFVATKKSHARLLIAGCVAMTAAFLYFGYR